MAGLETSIHQDAGDYNLARCETNVVGKPYEEKPHVRFDVAGSGNQDTGNPWLRRHSLTLPDGGLGCHAGCRAPVAPAQPAA